LCDDLNLGVHHIRVRLDGKLREAVRSPSENRRSDDQHEGALSQCEIDNSANHGSLPTRQELISACLVTEVEGAVRHNLFACMQA